MSQPFQHRNLPRLDRGWYRGRAAIFWTIATRDRARGWLDSRFHEQWRWVLLHTCSRYALLCPCYVLMPDHVHLLWLGIDDQRSEQLGAIEFLRKHLRPALAPVEWQHQAHDHVLRQHERTRGAFASTAYYIRENPVRASLANRPEDYPFSGCCLPGFPELNVNTDDYWDRFWRVHGSLVDPPLAGARGYTRSVRSPETTDFTDHTDTNPKTSAR